MDWVASFRNLKKIKNHSLLDCLHLFGTETIPIEDYEFVVFGKRILSGERAYEVFRFIGCSDEFLRGIHEIEWKSKRYKVRSLSYLRAKLFGFVDKLTFERSTFLIHPSRQLIRLRVIRNLLSCPIATPCLKRREHEQEKVDKIVHSCVEQMLYLYQRSFTEKSAEALVHFKKDMEAHINTIQKEFFRLTIHLSDFEGDDFEPLLV